MVKRKIVDARADEKGNIGAVKFEVHTNFTAVERAIPIVEREGSQNVHVVKPQVAKKHLRTNPDSSGRTEETCASNAVRFTQERHDELLKALVLQMRRSLELPFARNEKDFNFHLVGSTSVRKIRGRSTRP